MISKFVSWVNFAWLSHGWIHRPSRALDPRYLFAIIAVLLYCCVKCSLASYEKMELSGGAFNFDDGSGESLKDVHVPVLCDRIKPFQFSENLTPKGGGGRSERIASVQSVGEVKPNPQHDERAAGAK